MATVAPGEAVVRLDGKALDKLLKSPNGDVMRDMQRRGARVKLKAQELVGKKSHDLERSIVTRPVMIGTDPAVLVGVFSGRALKYVWIHHNGSKPHKIEAAPGKVLRFEIDGQVVFAKSVNHPGTKPNPFLKDALEVAVD